MQLPLAAIIPAAIPRDRTQIDEAALTELITSITLHGLRQPIKVFACDVTARLPPPYEVRDFPLNHCRY